jgi:serine protease Do
MADYKNQTSPSDEYIEKNKKRNILNYKLTLIVFLVGVIFISSVFGAFFGFLSSRLDSNIFSFLSGKKENIFEEPEIVKQKIIQEDSAVIDVVKKSAPAVVSIIIAKDIPKIKNFDNFPDFFGFDFFGYNQDSNGYDSDDKTEKQTIGGGTGFFITSDGMIVTNKHVVEDTKAEYSVVINDGKEYQAKVLARDPARDIAVIKIDGNDFPVLELGDSDAAQIGQTVIAIGNSLGEFSNTVSRGIISGLKRNITAGNNLGYSEKLNNIIQTDAAINSGNSGGPLLDISGKVIGINVAVAQGAQNVGFAIPSNQVKKVIEQVKSTGKISTPYIGVRYIPIDKTIQKENNLPYDYGDLIARGNNLTDFAVIPGSPADKAGLVENDIILEINGEKINDGEGGKSLADLITQYNVGDTLNFKVWHKGEIRNIPITLGERK